MWKKTKNRSYQKEKNKSIEIKAISIQKTVQQHNLDVLKNFYNNIKEKDLDSLSIAELKQLRDDGKMILDFHCNTDSKMDGMYEDIIKVQYYISAIDYKLIEKISEETKIESQSLKSLLNEVKRKNNSNKKEMNKLFGKIEKMKNEVNSIITTIISIVLSISVITASIAGIEKINANYILPFVFTIIFFGMIMVLFVYTIYKGKITIQTYTIVFIVFIIMFVFWILALNKSVDISNKSNNCNENYYKTIEIRQT